MKDVDLIRFYANDAAEDVAGCWEIGAAEADLPMHAFLLPGFFKLTDGGNFCFPPKLSKAALSNNLVLRLNRLDRVGYGWLAELQLANYYDALRSNFAMEQCPGNAGHSLREQLHGEARSVGSLLGNPLLNHLGIVAMIRTADENWIIQQRSSKVANRGKTSSASVSGAVSAEDIRTQDEMHGASGADATAPPLQQRINLRAVLERALRRECQEELAVPLAEVQFLGLLREFQRGGKPEAYFYARTAATLTEVVGRHRLAGDRCEADAISADVIAPPNFTLRTGLTLCQQLGLG
ncbi:MAG: hypothetical protein H8E15_04350 [Planctomycetes bacterium]|nr:hypothetical protein [Planctomycetota bacterium]